MVALKDSLSWADLSARFGQTKSALQKAIDMAGLTKQALPPGRKKKTGEPASAPAAAATADPSAQLARLAGKRPDAEVAVEVGVSADEVKAFRKGRGIAAYLKAPPVAALAPVAAVSEPSRPASTSRRRNAAGEPAKLVRPAVAASTPAAPPPAPRRPARAAPSGAPRAKPGPSSAIDAYADLLGTVPDSAIAAMAGSTTDAVKQYRRRRNIASFVPAAAATPAAKPARKVRNAPSAAAPVVAAAPPVAPAAAPAVAPVAAAPSAARTRRSGPARASKIDPYVHMVGVETDRTVADLAGVTIENVRAWRVRRRIPAAAARVQSRKVAPPAPVVVAPAEVPPTAGAPQAQGAAAPAIAAAVSAIVVTARVAFRVRASSGDRTRDFIMLGADVADAAQRAQVALGRRTDGSWRTVAIRELGEAVG